MSAPDPFQKQRDDMVYYQLEQRGINNPRVLDAMRNVPRHEFVPPEVREFAYQDTPLGIGDDQTISQPYIVGLMTQALRLSGHERVLEVGTGSGYQTAILCKLASYVYSLERFPALANHAAETLLRLGYNNVDIHVGDGSQGLPDMAPFDAIIVTAAAPAVPGPLRSQLHPQSGCMVVPVGDDKNQDLQFILRNLDRWDVKRIAKVRFVPLIGRYGFSVPPPSPKAGSTDEAPDSI